MESSPAIDTEATTAVFTKYGGVSAWSERYKRNELTDTAQQSCDDITASLLLLANEQRLILDSEQQLALNAANEGLMFGIYLLGYNFISFRNDMDEAQLEFALSHHAETLKSHALNHQHYETPDAGDLASGMTIDNNDAIPGFRQILDDSIDALCPTIEFQTEFRLGANMARGIFVSALEIIHKQAEQRFLDEFEKIQQNY